MRLHLSWRIVLCLLFIAQVNYVGSKRLQEEELLELQLKVENLVEKIINFIQDFYQNLKTELKCIPDRVSEALMETLKDAITCVEENEKEYNTGKITAKTRDKNFLKCLTNGKKEIRDMMESVDATIDYCPDNVTEKTYQINVTTTFSKTFRINIKNGLEMTKKEIELNKDTKHSFGGEEDVEVDESLEVGKKHRDTVPGGMEGQHGMKETDQGKPKNKMRKLSHEHNESNSTEIGTIEKSTKTKIVPNQGKHSEEGNSKKSNDSNQSDYIDEYYSELNSGSTEDSRDESSDETEHHVHRQFFKK